MSNKRRIIDIETKCRICLGDEGFMSYLFDELLFRKVENITKCTSVVIKQDADLPNKICHVCMYKLDVWDEFKEQFLKSNQILLAHLETPESNNLTLETENSKRKHDDSQASEAESLSNILTTKKSKPDETVDCVANGSETKEVRVSGNDENVSSLKENIEMGEKRSDLLMKDEDGKESVEAECKSDNLEEEKQPNLIPMRIRQLGLRRGKTTARRKASTKRWVARKKALLAATGEYGSDTDSIISDNESKLSPVQKARAKTNADKEFEKQKRLAKALKNLETDMKGEYGFKYDSDTIMIPYTDTEANKHLTRSQKKLIVDKVPIRDTKGLINSADKGSIEENEEAIDQTKNDSCILKESTLEGSGNSLSTSANLGIVMQDQNNEGVTDLESVFNPQPVRSELEIGDATYIVTSTLVLSEANYLNKVDEKNLSKDTNGMKSLDENSQERNTDIIDAVQLKRINPKSLDEGDDKQDVERCLNIEVEGTELEALQKVQAELAAFVEKDMKNILSNKNTPMDVDTRENKPKDSFQSLDKQLKAIVETAIRKNIETSSKPKNNPVTKIRTYRNQKLSTFSPAFVKAAMKSKIFQPKVLLMRLDLGKVRKRYRINNISLMEYQKSNDEDIQDRNTISNKRQTDNSLEYRTFNIMQLDSDDTVTSDDQIVTSTPKVYKNNVELMSEAAKTNKLLVKKLSGPRRRKKLSLSEQVLYAIRKGLSKDLALRRSDKPVCETVECDTTTKTLPWRPANDKLTPKKIKFSKSHENEGIKLQELNLSQHVCYICDKKFSSLDEKEEHVKSHKSPSSVSQSMAKSKKPRMMRCKRCHEIVDARLVRVHTCRSVKSHKCYICNVMFRSEKMLVSHLETHDGSEFNIDNIERGQSGKKTTSVSSTQEAIAQRAADSNTTTIEFSEKEEKPVILEKEEYTCFVCDKKFTDEEILKDHLQEHCNDVSEEDESSGKEQYQCAICGDSLETEDALESHLEKHMCDDGDDNPNLINISNDSDHNKETEKEIYKCSQCAKEFDSEISLTLHVQAHEEELAIEEWQRESTEGNKNDEQYYCMICDEPFDNQEEFSEHLDVHNSNSHVCFLCEKPFLSLEDLQTHVASH